MTMSSAPPTFTVYFTTLPCVRKKRSTSPVNRPTAKNGSTKPLVYTAPSPKPAAAEALDDAISSTLASTGPTHGVHAKLNVKPSTSATSGFIANLFSRNGRRRSFSPAFVLPNAPSMYRPNAAMMTPATIENTRWFPVKNWPSAVNPKPSRKNAKLTPTTKNSVFTNTFLRGYSTVPSSFATPAPPAR